MDIRLPAELIVSYHIIGVERGLRRNHTLISTSAAVESTIYEGVFEVEVEQSQVIAWLMQVSCSGA